MWVRVDETKRSPKASVPSSSFSSLGCAAAHESSESTPLLLRRRRGGPPGEEGSAAVHEDSWSPTPGRTAAAIAALIVGAMVLFGAASSLAAAPAPAESTSARGWGWGLPLWGSSSSKTRGRDHRGDHGHGHGHDHDEFSSCDRVRRELMEVVEKRSRRREVNDRRDDRNHYHDHHHPDTSSEPHHESEAEQHQTFQGRILRPDRRKDAKAFDASVAVWNERYNSHTGHSRNGPPCAVVIPSNELDLEVVVPVLVRHGAELVIKSGGHCYADYSSSSSSRAAARSDGPTPSTPPRVLLDLSQLNDLHFGVDPLTSGARQGGGDTVLATMGPGTTMGQILHQKSLHDDLIRRRGTYGRDHDKHHHHHVDKDHNDHDHHDDDYYAGVLGSSSTVAAGGYMLGGGYGYWSRKHGLAIDNLVEARVVLANGTVAVANAHQHSDLFWALRGAGQATLGVVTQYTYRLYRAHRNVLVATASELSPQDLIPLLVSAPGDGAAGSTSNKSYPLDCHMEVMGTLEGAELDVACPGATERDLDELHEQVKAYMKEQVPYKVSKKLLYNRTSWVGLAQAETDNFEGIMVQFWNGLLPQGNNNVETWESLIDTLFGLSHKNPHILVDIELRGGAIAKVDPAATAYPWREAAYVVGIGVLVSPKERHADAVFREQVDRVNTAWEFDISPHLEGMFPNYAMESLRAAAPHDASRLAWGDNLSRLQEIKASYDPTNAFHSALPIDLTPAPLTREEETDHAPTAAPLPTLSLPPTEQPSVQVVAATELPTAEPSANIDLPTAEPSTNPIAADTGFPTFAIEEPEAEGEDGDGITATPTLPPTHSEVSAISTSSGAPAVPAMPPSPTSSAPARDPDQSASSSASPSTTG